jgi:hypothetical protein
LTGTSGTFDLAVRLGRYAISECERPAAMRGCVFRQCAFPERNARLYVSKAMEWNASYNMPDFPPASRVMGRARSQRRESKRATTPLNSRCGLLLAEAIEAHDFRALTRLCRLLGLLGRGGL